MILAKDANKNKEDMIDSMLKNIDFLQLFNIITTVIAFFVAYLKILPLIPRSANKILSDIEVYKKSEEIDIQNKQLLKDAIEREIGRKYRKPTRVQSYPQFIISFLVIIVVGYFIYTKANVNQLDNTLFFQILIVLIALITLMDSFNEKEDKKEIIIKERIPVFKFEIFSWSELIGGVFLILIFGFWTYFNLFKNGHFEFNWWSLLTGIFVFSGIGMLTGAFKREKKEEHKNKQQVTSRNQDHAS